MMLSRSNVSEDWKKGVRILRQAVSFIKISRAALADCVFLRRAITMVVKVSLVFVNFYGLSRLYPEYNFLYRCVPRVGQMRSAETTEGNVRTRDQGEQ